MLTNNDFSILLSGSNPNYTGYGSAYSDSGQNGINLNNLNYYHVKDLFLHNLAGAGIDIQNTAGGWQHVGYISNVAVSNSVYGFKFTNSAEYETVSDCNAYNCTFGFLVDSGNTSLNNCKAIFCSIGFKYSGGTNNAHGVATGLQANHCTYNLSCQNITLGQSFDGCTFIAGQAGSDQGVVQIYNSQGISINGGQIAYANVTVDSTSQLSLRGVTLRGPVNFSVVSGGILDCKNNLVMAGSTITLNGVPFSGNN